jgi:H+-transporting ATPase
MTAEHEVIDAGLARHGLTTERARQRLAQYGLNAVAEEKPNLLLAMLRQFWAPVPWMLEVTIVLELVLDKNLEALIIGVLLIFNAALSLFQEKRAHDALDLLRRRLVVEARVLRDGAWRLLPAQELVPGDFVHVRMGDMVPADIRLAEGAILLDQSALTGESLPVEAAAGSEAYAGALVKRGEASGEITATGSSTFFGKTAELVREAKTRSHLESVIFTIVRYLVMMDGALVVALLVYSWLAGMALADTLPFALILLVASVPVALPATFTLATALGSVELAGRGVLATRLTAIEEAAAMDVLCSDKTGTITENRLTLARLRPYPPFSEDELLGFASFASDEATQDPIDLAILSAAAQRTVPRPSRLCLIPFDPATKLAEAVIRRDGQEWHAIKGAPGVLASRVTQAPGDLDEDLARLAADGYRVLAVAAGPAAALRMAGLLALEDAPRADSADVIRSLRNLGVRVLMITGDTAETARAVAAQVGIDGDSCSVAELHGNLERALGCAMFAGVFPEDKFHLVRSLQDAGHVVGMTGDGVNDAPALKQAEVGIAVASATDVAKAAASLVLANPGLTDILAAVETSRRIYQRMLTYTLNKIIKTVQIALFLSLGVMLTRTFIITPLLIVLLLFANDFVTMSIATDRVSFSSSPDRWHIGSLMRAGLALGSFTLVICFAIFLFARDALALSVPQLQTLVFLTLVFTGQGTVYLVRERQHFWNSVPSRWLMVSSVADIIVVSVLATHGLLMAAVPTAQVCGVLFACLLYLAGLDFLKVAILRRLHYAV